MAKPTAHKILVIDDHLETLQIVAHVLEQNGFVTVKARSGLQGLALAETEDPDLVLLDGMMPELNGWEVCRRLREMPRFAETPIIMFSASDEAEQKLAGFDAGADDYLTKPTDPEEMLERVNTMLEHREPKAVGTVKTAVKPPTVDKTSPMKTMTFAPSTDVIAVMGSRGGAGATTLAINLASVLARSHRQTTLIDLGLPGHAALYLNQKNHRPFYDLRHATPDEIMAKLPHFLIPYPGGMHLLLQDVQLDHRWESWSPTHLTRLLDALLMTGNKVVVDLGHLLQEQTQTILSRAGTLLLCTRPERISLTATKQALAAIDPRLVAEERRHIVVMDFTGQMQVPQQALEKYLRQKITGVVSITPNEMTHAVNKGRPLVQDNPESSASRAITQLTRQFESKLA